MSQTKPLTFIPRERTQVMVGKKAIRLIPVGSEEEGEEWFLLPTDSDALHSEGFLMNLMAHCQWQVMLRGVKH